MAELTGKAISELPEATDVQNDDLLALNQGASSKKVTVETLLDHAKLKYTEVSVGSLVVSAKSVVDYDTGIAPQSNKFQVLAYSLSWCYIISSWVANDHVNVTVANPMDFQVTTPEWSSIRIFWL